MSYFISFIFISGQVVFNLLATYPKIIYLEPCFPQKPFEDDLPEKQFSMQQKIDEKVENQIISGHKYIGLNLVSSKDDQTLLYIGYLNF